MFKVQRLLSIDTRSLALVRISLAGLVLTDLFQRAADLQAHYSDFGVLPTWATKYILQYQPSHWSLHLLTPKLYWLSGSWLWQALLFGVAGLAAGCMLLGLRTRWATIITWILLTSATICFACFFSGRCFFHWVSSSLWTENDPGTPRSRGLLFRLQRSQ